MGYMAVYIYLLTFQKEFYFLIQNYELWHCCVLIDTSELMYLFIWL
jgi:hypothetical protein